MVEKLYYIYIIEYFVGIKNNELDFQLLIQRDVYDVLLGDESYNDVYYSFMFF